MANNTLCVLLALTLNACGASDGSRADRFAGDASDAGDAGCTLKTDPNVPSIMVELCEGADVPAGECQKMVTVSWEICPSSIYCDDTRTCQAR